LLKAELRQLRIRNLAAEKRLIADARSKEKAAVPGILNSSIQQQMLKQLTASLDQWADLLFPVHAHGHPGWSWLRLGRRCPTNETTAAPDLCVGVVPVQSAYS